jgi:hypothetical protein
MLHLRSYQTAWTWLHKLRHAMAGLEQDRLAGSIEVDIVELWGELSSLPSRGKPARGLVVIAAEADGESLGRIRMRTIQNDSVDSLHTFVQDCIAPASSLLTTDWHGYTGLEQKGYQHEVQASAGSILADSDGEDDQHPCYPARQR